MLYGIIEYKGKKYIYSLKANLLCMELMEDLGKKCVAFEWIVNPPTFNEDYLRGTNAENGNLVLFKIYSPNVGFTNTQIQLRIQYYIELEKDEPINKICITGDEINYIYDIGQGIEEYKFGEEGMASCKTKTFEETTSQMEYFNVRNKKIGVYFTIYRKINFRSCFPLNLYSAINLLFDTSRDYDFLIHLCYIIKKLLGFMCYRNNINLEKIQLYTESSNKKYEKVGEIFLFNKNEEKELEKIVKERNITYNSIKDNIGNILQDIEDEKLYLRHIPSSYRDKLKFDYSKFIIITAAVEWIFKTLYPNGIKHKEATLKAQEQVKESLLKKIDESTGEIKKQYKFLIGLIGSDSLSQKIVQIGKDYNALIGDIGKHLYTINNLGEEFNYSKIGARIQSQRNNFAHGNLDREFEENAILDLSYLEIVIYLLQLTTYNISHDVAIEQVKRLFGIRF